MHLVHKADEILRQEGFRSLIDKGYRFAKNKSKDGVYTVLYSHGSGRRCPICGFTGKKFIPDGMEPRPDAKCPDCGAKERHRLLWHYIVNKTEILDKDNDVLYFAPTYSIEKKLREKTNLTTTDLLEDSVDVHADIIQLPFKDSSFDYIICSHVLEHIPDDSEALSELYRVMNSDGDALIMVPKDKFRSETYEDTNIVSPEIRKAEFRSSTHVRRYGPDFTDRLSNAGFEVSVNTYARELKEEYITKYGFRIYYPEWDLWKYEDIHHCTK